MTKPVQAIRSFSHYSFIWKKRKGPPPPQEKQVQNSSCSKNKDAEVWHVGSTHLSSLPTVCLYGKPAFGTLAQKTLVSSLNSILFFHSAASLATMYNYMCTMRGKRLCRIPWTCFSRGLYDTVLLGSYIILESFRCSTYTKKGQRRSGDVRSGILRRFPEMHAHWVSEWFGEDIPMSINTDRYLFQPPCSKQIQGLLGLYIRYIPVPSCPTSLTAID